MKTPKVKVQSEALECQRLTAWLRSKGILHTHVANETKSKTQAIRNKRLGTSAGFPDYVIVFPGQVVFVEMKRVKGGRVSTEQKEWIEALRARGHTAHVCAGFEEAKKTLETYL